MTEVVAVGTSEHAVLDVVLVHGLDGNAHTSWARKQPGSFWPLWLEQDIAGLSIWSVGYDAASSRWLGHAMPIQDRAINLLAQLQNYGIGQRPLCFVTHSMGGMVVKEMLLHAAEGRAGYSEFATATCGVVFLATPHTGSDLTKLVQALGVVYRATPAVEDLRRNSAHLRQLNDRYRDWVAEPTTGISHRVFFETLPTKGVHVVDAGSANPGLAGVRPIPVDTNHIDICKPADRNSLVYGQVKLFITDIRDNLTRQGEDRSTAGSGSGLVSGDTTNAASGRTEPRQGPVFDHLATIEGDVSGIVSTGDHTRIEQHTHVHQPVDQLPMEHVTPPASAVINLPARSELFLGRDDDLARLHHAMTSARIGTVVVTAVHGLGGVGKSTLAAHYAQAHRGEFSLVWWITAETPSAIVAGLAELAVALRPDLVQAPLEQQAELARRWLATNDGWLLILDNLHAPSDAVALLARLPGGRVLITSRRTTGWHAIAAAVNLDVLQESDAVDLLNRIAPAYTDTKGEDTASLCRELGFLPLAIEQAGAYMAETGTTPFEYLDLVNRYPAAMYRETAEGGDAQRTMARIWRVTLDHLASTPLAGQVLRLLAWYAPDDIPIVLLAGLIEEPLLRKAIGRLAAYGMIIHNQGLVGVHRLVQAVTRTPDPDDPHRTPGQIDQARDDATRALAQHMEPLNPRSPGDWPTFQPIIPHAQALIRHTDNATDTPDTLIVLNRAGQFLGEHGRLEDALSYLSRSRTSSERINGPDHSDTLASRNNLAYAYHAVGDLGKAIPLVEAVVADDLRIHGADHPGTLTSRNNLAHVYHAAGDLRKAIPLFEAVIADRMRVLGADHPHTLTSRNDLALAYRDVGDPERAIPLFETVVVDHLRIQGADHPDTLTSRDNLAGAYQAAGDLGKAIRLFEAVVADRMRVLGADHPDTLISRNNLAFTYQTAGDLGRAISLYEAAGADAERVLGSDHPAFKTIRTNLHQAQQKR